MKKKKNWIIVGIVLFFLFVLVGTTIIVGNDLQKRNQKVQKRTEKIYPAEQTIYCIRENIRDDVTVTEEVYLQNGELVTRTNTAYWSKVEPREMTCKYYTDLAAGLTGRPGVTSITNCDDKSGRNTTIYRMNEIDQTDLKLKQFDFVDSYNKFDAQAWKIYMEKDEYTCEIS